LIDAVCSESRKVAAHDARRALGLARLARQLAELAPGTTDWRSAIQSKAWAFEANALRVMPDLQAAESAFAAAWEVRQRAGQMGELVFPEWRLLDLEASLRCDQRRIRLALDLQDRALRAAPPEARGLVLLNKAFTLEQAGQSHAALSILADAMPLVDATNEPRLRMGVRFNTVVNLWRLRRLDEAEASLSELHAMVVDLRNDYDLVRFDWLAARIAASRGRHEEALTLYGHVRSRLRPHGNANDAALVCLEMAVLFLEEGRSAEVASLAQDTDMLWMLKAPEMRTEALSALRLFRDAAARLSVTAEMVQTLRDRIASPLAAALPDGTSAMDRPIRKSRRRPASRRGR
jgi:tetratricopeptide (TPR) repeat protein